MGFFSHTHDREPIAVQHASASPLFSPAKATIVLWRCRCGDLTTQRLEGEWTLSQVRGERELTGHERTEADLLIQAAAGEPA